jgi:hypothetical protein
MELINGSASKELAIDDVGAVMERVMVSGDLSPLTPTQRSEYYMRVCQSVGLNPLTKPFAYIKLNGKLTLYALRDCADQLRNIYGISIEIVDRKLTDGFLSVHVRATNKDGRKDEDYGVVPIAGTLAGEAGANLIMKAVTKAKRRVTLSICGLGMLDETEVVTVPGAEIVDVEGLKLAAVPQPPPARDSSAEGKRNKGDVRRFNDLRAKLENPASATECGETWTQNAEFLRRIARGWYETLLEAYTMSMKGFGVEIDPADLDQHSLMQAAE